MQAGAETDSSWHSYSVYPDAGTGQESAQKRKWRGMGWRRSGRARRDPVMETSEDEEALEHETLPGYMSSSIMMTSQLPQP